MSQGIPLKETALNAVRVTQIATDLHKVHPDFEVDEFVGAVMTQLPALELKDRIACVAEQLARSLPDDFAHATKIVLAALPPHDDLTFTGSDFGIYTYAPYSEFVARYGCTADHLDISLTALRELTKHFSAEVAVRYFINAFPEQTMTVIEEWSRDDDYHVRRLASEGLRPKLPWAQGITLDPAAAIPILDRLRTDPARFVLISVANHLNDLSRLNPDLVIATLTRWQSLTPAGDKTLNFLIAQGLRALIKAGDARAIDFLGLSSEPTATVTDLTLNSARIPMGATLQFEFTLTGVTPEKLIIDYVLRYPRPSGKHGEKVFKLKTTDVTAGQIQQIRRAQHLRPTANRSLSTGPGELIIQVNGKPLARTTFEIVAARS